MTELSTLERKRLSDLHQIASQLGIEQYRKYRKPELAQMIYKVATEQAAEQTASRREAPVQSAPEPNGEAGVPTIPESAADDTAFDGTADGAVEALEVPEQRRQEREQETRERQERGGRGEELFQSATARASVMSTSRRARSSASTSGAGTT
jgi:transcription termination factor Rho